MRTPQVQISLHHLMDVSGCPRPLIGRGPHLEADPEFLADQIRPEHRAAGATTLKPRRMARTATGHPHTGTQGGATAILVGLESIYETHVSHACTASDRTIGPGSLHNPRNGLIEERG